MKDGEWGDEEKYDLLEAFYPGRQFHIQFNVRDDDYEVRFIRAFPIILGFPGTRCAK